MADVFSGAPDDPLTRLIWIRDVLLPAIAYEKRQAYFACRMQGQLEDAIAVGLDSRTRVLAETRHANEAMGRSVRWQSG